MRSVASCGNAIKQKSSPKKANHPQARTFRGKFASFGDAVFLHAVSVGLARSRARPTVSVSSPASRTIQASKTRNVSNPPRKRGGRISRFPKPRRGDTTRAEISRGDVDVSAPSCFFANGEKTTFPRGNPAGTPPTDFNSPMKTSPMRNHPHRKYFFLTSHDAADAPRRTQAHRHPQASRTCSAPESSAST